MRDKYCIIGLPLILFINFPMMIIMRKVVLELQMALCLVLSQQQISTLLFLIYI